MLVVPFGPASSYQQDVTSKELYSRIRSHRFQVRHSDRVLRHWSVFDAILLSISYIIEQYPTTYDASTFGPVFVYVSLARRSDL